MKIVAALHRPQVILVALLLTLATAITVAVLHNPSAQAAADAADADAAEAAAVDKVADVGAFEAIEGETNDNTRSVIEARTTGRHPERLTPAISPTPFDKAAFDRDSTEYLRVVEPGRVFQPAQPGDDVPVLARVSPGYVEINQGESVILQVRAVAGAPVTFTSFDAGAFSNKLGSLTVLADAEGTAQAEFFGTRGTANEVNILSASPLTSGQVPFTVYVAAPLVDKPEPL